MLLGKIKHLLFEEIKDSAAGGDPESAKPATSQAAPSPEAVQEAGESTVDDHGYDIVKPKQEGAQDKKASASKESQQADSEDSDEIKDPVSGYDEKEIEAAAAAKEKEKPVEDKKPPEAAKSLKDELGYELAVPEEKELPKEDSQKIVELAKAHKLPKEATEALLAQKKLEYQGFLAAQKESQEVYKKAIADQKASWFKELKEDPEFGGEKLNKSLNRAEKVLQDFFPATKKVLTERKSMLPPYVMRDLAKAYEHLYRPESFTQGDKPSADKNTEQKEENNPLDFYT